MKFVDILKDIESMAGLDIQSITPGSSISIVSIDYDNKRIILTSSSGKFRSRPFSELEKLWVALSNSQAIHVDSVLLGSGSSRNQPETILANLPYIEWFKYKGKKHLSLVLGNPHRIGTLKKMDILDAERLKTELDSIDNQEQARSINNTTAIVVCSNIKHLSRYFEALSGRCCIALGEGLYQIANDNTNMLIVNKVLVPIVVQEGVYSVFDSKLEHSDSIPFALYNAVFTFHQEEGLKFFTRHHTNTSSIRYLEV
ncbi:MAG: hypothetical protein CVU48_05960 [Candidatus Cloacimonetes bacterium HGW-Cloacimonetes-1]|jgi:hypothetical protein|nr:MAG: hypothetical protein CVU48_05960 [Candidatus Cloacimonetes bacterium HGW-Cloacimonetes-1]